MSANKYSSILESFHQRLGSQAMVDDLADLGMEDMSQYDSYKDKSQNVETSPSLDEPDATLEWEDQILNA